MVRVMLHLPPDSTFLSEVLYGGLMFLLKNASKFNSAEIDFSPDFLSKVYSSLDDERIDSIRIVMSGNDSINAKIFEKFDLNVKSRKTYYDLIKLLKDNADKLTSKEEINVELKVHKKDILMDASSKSDGIAAPQLFKVDRYTGLSSLDTNYTSQQLTFYFSKEIALIALLGIYSSFVISVRQQQQTYHYFLFFSPDEIAGIMNSDRRFVEKLFLVKDEVAEQLRSLLSNSTLNELLLVELTLNLELQRLMERENLDKVSLILFKVAPEGQTYKIYEQIPITVHRNPAFYTIAERYFRDAAAFCEKLGKALTSDAILKTLASMNRKNKYSEADNVLKAIQMIYRFVVLGDTQGWFGFLREMHNAYSKLANSSDGRERKRAKNYLNLVKFLV